MLMCTCSSGDKGDIRAAEVRAGRGTLLRGEDGGGVKIKCKTGFVSQEQQTCRQSADSSIYLLNAGLGRKLRVP